MGRGRPKLNENPFAYRAIIRNFIIKYGEDKFKIFLRMGSDSAYTKSEISSSLGIGFGVVSRLHGIVYNQKSTGVRPKVKVFLLSFYGVKG